MAKVALSQELSDHVAERIAAFATVPPTAFQWHREYVPIFGALPLYSGWFDTIALRPDGEFISWSTQDEYEGTRPVEDRCIWLSSLIHATRHHYPELQVLLPSRPADARDCRHLGHPLFAEGRIICPECCGLGWVEG